MVKVTRRVLFSKKAVCSVPERWMDPGARVSLEVKLGATAGTDGTRIEEEEDDAEFTGPHFDELDEALQAEFEAFLEARGVTPSLGGALAALAEDKEAREYAAWLAKVRDFVAAR